MSHPQTRNNVVITIKTVVYILGCIVMSNILGTGKLSICPIEIYINKIPKIANTISQYNVLFFSFSGCFFPKLLKPASSTNLSKSEIVRKSSYSTDAVANTKLTTASITPFCFFKYFSKPLEQALHVIPSIFKITFFAIF